YGTHGEKEEEPDPPVPDILAYDGITERDEQQANEIDPPNLVRGITAIEEGRQSHLDEGPASTVAGTNGFRSTRNGRIDDRPAYERPAGQDQQSDHEDRQCGGGGRPSASPHRTCRGTRAPTISA